jgi:hypothetical protein
MNEITNNINWKQLFDYKTTESVDKTGLRHYYGARDSCSKATNSPGHRIYNFFGAMAYWRTGVMGIGKYCFFSAPTLQ